MVTKTTHIKNEALCRSLMWAQINVHASVTRHQLFLLLSKDKMFIRLGYHEGQVQALLNTMVKAELLVQSKDSPRKYSLTPLDGEVKKSKHINEDVSNLLQHTTLRKLIEDLSELGTKTVKHSPHLSLEDIYFDNGVIKYTDFN